MEWAVRRDDGLEFRPVGREARSGLIFLPAAIVDPAAYAPLIKRIAQAGYRAHLLYLPMRGACTDSQVQELFRKVQGVAAADSGTSWVLAGHSRGGDTGCPLCP